MRQLFTHGLRNERQKDAEIGPLPETWVHEPLGSFGRNRQRINTPQGEYRLLGQRLHTLAHQRRRSTTSPFERPTSSSLKPPWTNATFLESNLEASSSQSPAKERPLGHAVVTPVIETCVAGHRVPEFRRHSGESALHSLVPRKPLLGTAEAWLKAEAAQRILTCGFLKTFLVPKPSPKNRIRSPRP